MKKEIQPKTFEVTVRCVCGNSFQTSSTLEDLRVEICSACHPFFTGTQKFVDEAGRIEKFDRRYKKVAEKATKKSKK